MSSAEFKDYYATLGVRKTANISEIKKKFRQLALKYHPDRNQGNKVAEAKFKEISEAYDVLSDEDKRKKYHHFGQYWQKDVSTEHTTSRSTNNHSTTNSKVDFNSTDFSQYSNFDEFINELLGRFSSPSSSSTSSANSSQGSNFPGFSQTETSSFVDDEASINLTYAEAFRGITKKLNLEQEIVEIRIPAGVKPNSRIRLAGKGKPSISGGSRDLYLKIKLNPHAFFSFEGDDLVCEVPITPDEAVLGSSINVPTPDGMVSMKIPAGINSGQVLRLRDKGWISPQGNRTDQLVKIVVETPQKINAQEREYYEKIRDLRLENPRSNLERISL